MDVDLLKEIRWTAFPPVKLFGVATRHVESLEHYVSRLAWIVGSTPLKILDFGAAAPKVTFAHPLGAVCGPHAHFSIRVALLERLTGVDTLHCGTYTLLSEVADHAARGLTTYHRRWCGFCYERWEIETSFEPLAWACPLVCRCPFDGHLLSSRCPGCDSHQPYWRDYEVRRSCASCGSTLGLTSFIATPSRESVWVESQVYDLIQACATPGWAAFRASSYGIFMRGISARIKEAGFTRDLLISDVVDCMLRRSDGLRFDLDLLINACALNGVTSIQALADPVTASSPPFDFAWASYVPIDTRPHELSARRIVFEQIIFDLVAAGADVCLPSPRFIAKHLGLGRLPTKVLSSPAYKSYTIYRAQRGKVQRVRSTKQLEAAVRHLSKMHGPIPLIGALPAYNSSLADVLETKFKAKLARTAIIIWRGCRSAMQPDTDVLDNPPGRCESSNFDLLSEP